MGALQPGYIKGYVPGIRENGGQYTHAATWVVLATALQGHGDRAAGALEPAQPDPPRRDARGGAALQGRAVRRLRRRLWCSAAHRPRRLDLVYRLGRLAVSRRSGSDPRFPSAWHTLRLDPCIPPGWPGYEITYRHRSATYRVQVDNSAGTGRGVRAVWSTAADSRTARCR